MGKDMRGARKAARKRHREAHKVGGGAVTGVRDAALTGETGLGANFRGFVGPFWADPGLFWADSGPL